MSRPASLKTNARLSFENVIKFPFAGLVSLVLLEGCSPTINELWINKNGSGHFEQTWDMTTMINLNKATMLTEEEMEEEAQSVEFLKSLTHHMGSLDSSFTLGSFAREHEWSDLNLGLLDKITLQSRISMNDISLTYILKFDFRNPEEFSALQEATIQFQISTSDSTVSELPDSRFHFDYSRRNKILRFTTLDYDYPMVMTALDNSPTDSIPISVQFENKINSLQVSDRMKTIGQNWLNSPIMTKIHLPYPVQHISNNDIHVSENEIVCSYTIREMLDKELGDTVLVSLSKKNTIQ
jgi:hypothetical protein